MRRLTRYVPFLFCVLLATAAWGQSSAPTGDLFVTSIGTGHLIRLDGSTATTIYDLPEDSHTYDLVKGPDGALYVSTLGPSVIKVDLATGELLGTFASGGGLSAASGVAFGPDGNLYVGDLNTSSVKRYNGATGVFIDTFVASGSGGLTLTRRLRFGPDRNLYVTETGGNRVLHYNGMTGAFLGVFASHPSVSGVEAMVFGPDGNLFVAGSSSQNVVRFDSRTGAFKDVFVRAINPINGLAFGPDGNLYVSGASAYKISRFDRRTGSFIGDFASVIQPSAVLFDLPPPVTNDLFAAAEAPGRVLRFDGTTGSTVYDAFESSVAIDLVKGPDGALYMSTNGQIVIRVDPPSGASSGIFATGGGLSRSVGVAFGPDGNLYVGDGGTSSVLRYNGSTGSFIDTFVPSGGGGLFQTEALLFGPDRNLYVTEFSGNRVLRYDGTTGAFVDVFATDPSLAGARSMAFGPDGNLYVAGNFSNNVVRFDGATGAFLDVFVAGISGANGLAFGPEGNLYVAAQGADKISRFDGRSGMFLGNFASVTQPIGLTFDVCTPPATGGGLDHSSGFSCHGDFIQNGNTTFAGTVARLTDSRGGEASSIFTVNRFDITQFTTSFKFRIWGGTNPPADGLCFVIQGNDPFQLGAGGSGKGYEGIRNSLCVKFDIYSDAGGGPDSTGLFGDGRLPTVPQPDSGDVRVDLRETGIDLHSQHTFQVDLTYDGTTLTQTITDLNTPNAFTTTYGSVDSPLNIPGMVGGSAAFLGFTGGTGGLSATQDVQTWTFRNP